MTLLLTILAVFIILCTSEFWARKRGLHSELSRKFVHLTVGSFVAFWPFFLSWNQIRFLSLAFIVVVCVSKWLNIFQAIHSVERPTLGEVYFAAVVGLLTFVTQSKGIYAAALLQMSLADGLAAVIGVRYGMRRKYKVFGHIKTMLGTATFFVTSVLLLCGYVFWTGDHSLVLVLGLASAATLTENVAVAGLDNLFVPLGIAWVLQALA